MPVTVPSQGEFDAVTVRVTDLENAVIALNSRLTAVETKNTAQDATLANHETRIKALEPIVPAPSTLKIGAYYLGIADMSVAKAKGVTHGHVRTSPTVSAKSYLDAAAASGLEGVYIELGWRASDGVACFTHADITATLKPEILNHAMLKGIMLVDEPDHQGKRYDPAEITAAYQHTKSLAPTIPVLNVMTWERELSGNTNFLPSAGYVPASDQVGVDRYPIPYGLPGENFVKAGVQKAKAAAGTKPVVAAIQTFDWNNLFGPSRPPTTDEIRKMGLAAIGEGVRILFLYSWGELKAECPDSYTNLGVITAAWRTAAV